MSTNQTQTGEMDDVDLVSELEEDEDGQEWGDWNADDDGEGDGLDSDALLCLFCDLKHGSSEALFEHCCSTHRFDFNGIRKTMGLDFYGCFKLINYVRSQVAENRCWSCGFTCQSKQDLQSHAHEAFSFKDTVLPWGDDRYLKPLMQEDPLLYSFGEDWVVDDEDTTSDNKITELIDFEKICINDDKAVEEPTFDFNTASENGRTESASASDSCLNGTNPCQGVKVSSVDVNKVVLPSDMNSTDKDLKVSFAKVEANEIKSVNKNYFGLYSSFGIHREMISDKVRTDAYRQALLNNPSLLRGATVLDVGCGTGILSLFACQAGASGVIAVEASEKMAAVATQIAKDNGLLCSGGPSEGTSQGTGVMKVVQGMVEELVNCKFIQPHSIDVLLSEWMGYCLLYESMLSSVLLARDRWLKPGGAILPDTATMFVAGFGKGGTCIPFWETVYGFNMSCVGKELVEDAARVPLVDVIDSGDIVTNTGVLQSFDLVKMTPDDMDFTSTIKLEPLKDNPTHNSDSLCKITWCYGIVLWFETGFTSRFCKDMPIVLSTSPYTPKTHWSQTILTFREPIAISSGSAVSDTLAAVGTDACPAAEVHLRISIARPASPHRSIDISLEIAAIVPDGRKRSWPVQMFNLS